MPNARDPLAERVRRPNGLDRDTLAHIDQLASPERLGSVDATVPLDALRIRLAEVPVFQRVQLSVVRGSRRVCSISEVQVSENGPNRSSIEP